MIPRLKDGDHIITAFAEPASGPGWTNSPIWVVIKGRSGTLRMECLQPNDYLTPESSDIAVLYRGSAVAHEAMTGAVRAAMGREDRP